MSKLKITDNHDFIRIDAPPDDWYYYDNFDGNILNDLQRIANVEIEKLSEKIDDNNILFFPRELDHYGDNISKGKIISLKNGYIATGNIMGFVGVNNTQVDIISRFSKTNDEDFFLHYMLQKVFSINMFNFKHSSSSQPVFDFLLYLFPHFLKRALSQGIFRKYRHFEYNNSTIRGTIDVNRHIRENTPFKGTVAYSTRELSYDNEVTELVRHTIEYIKTKEMGGAILNNDNETKAYVSQIIQATPTYNARNRRMIINLNLKPIRHPYYTEYSALQKICIQILKQETIKYGQDKNKIYGILFDGAWLWEEYLSTIFKKAKVNITHAKNKERKNGIPLYQGGRKNYYPDFYKQQKCDKDGSHSFVLDAKYKRLEHGGDVDQYGKEDNLNHISINREDLFQMITYMHVLPAKHCALLYPIERKESHNIGVVESKTRELEGFGGEIFGYGISIANSNNYNEFCQFQLRTENQLINKIENWIG